MKTQESKGSRVRIMFLSYDVSAIDDVARRIIAQTNKLGLKSSGVVMLPNRRRVFSLLDSPHIFKKAQSHYQYVSHKRLITVYGLDNLQNYQNGLGIIPSSVDMRIKIK